MEITPAFNSVAAGPAGETGVVSSGPAPTGPIAPAASGEFATATDNSYPAPSATVAQRDYTPGLTLESAEAELEMLESGRATPAARHNFNPPSKLKKIVDAKIEREREARVSALKAYVQFKKNEPMHDAHHAQGEELAFNL
jgi:hypothetical protein